MKRESQTEHDKMVESAAKLLIKNNFTGIKADIDNYERPKKITWKDTGEGHIPDVNCKGEKQNIIIEVETEDSINHEHTKDQWTLFSAFAKQHDAVFWVAIPEGSEDKAKKRIVDLKIGANIWKI